jgi:putative spermidine/putrescine transport system substrate-binding protein
LGLGGAFTLGLASCGGDDVDPTTAPPPGSGSPVAIVPGYGDPTKWANRTLRVGAFGGEVQAALREALFRPFALATGCTVVEVATDYGLLATSVAGGAAYADLLLVDPLWLAANAASALLEPVGDLTAHDLSPVGPAERSAPVYIYALVNAFRRDAVNPEDQLETWRDWWDQEAFAGPRTLPRRALGTLEVALLADGVDRDDVYPLDI